MAEEKTLTHWAKTRDTNFLGGWDIEPGKELVLTIAKVAQETVENPIKKTKQVKTVIHFAERDYKPMVLNTTNKKAIAKALNTPYIENWIGKQVKIYTLHGTWFGEEQDALRIRDKAPDTKIIVCEECKKPITRVNDKEPSELAEISRRNCNGKALCVACQKKYKAEMDKKAVKEEKPEHEPVKEEKVEPVTETKADSDDEW